jgi:hypothetical protein
MRAIEIRIHNFRSIKDAEIELAPYSLIIGPNNAGKSNIVDALRVFYENLKYDDARDFPMYSTEDKEAWIEIQYKPTEEELSQLKDEYRFPDGTFRIRKFLQSLETDDEGKRRLGIYAYVEGRLSGSRFYGAKNVQQGKLGEVIYIPAVSKLDEHTKLSGPSALRDLLNAVLKGILSSSRSYVDLRTAFDTFGESLKQETTPEGHSLERLEKEISHEIEEWGTKCEILINAVSPDEIVKSLVSHRILDDALGKALDPSAFGQGFQRQLIYTLLKLAARYQAPRPPPRKKEFAPHLTLILFEEPEAFLHPPQVEVLDESLRTFSHVDGQQILISSHSPQFASRNVDEMPAMVRLCREGAITQVGQIRSKEMPNLLRANQEVLEDLKKAGVNIDAEDSQIDMESIKYALWLNPLRCSAFFATRVILVEGTTERGLFGYLLAHDRLNAKDGSVFFLDTFGKWNIHRFMNLLGGLRVPHAVLYDEGSRTAEDKAVEKGILSAQNEFTAAIDSFENDIEAFLGIPKATRPHRKPQHVMWCLMQDKIEEERVRALCNKVQALIEA